MISHYSMIRGSVGASVSRVGVCVPIRTPSIPWEIALLAVGCVGHQHFSQEYKSQTIKTFMCSALGVFGLMTGVLFFGGWFVCLMFFYLPIFRFLNWPLVTFLGVRFGACSS